MQLAASSEFLSVDDYLAAESVSEIKHEYIGGTLYAMAGATQDHNRIALNLYSALRQGPRGAKCSAFVSDLKVRLRLMGDDVFYYPDVVVTCDPRDTHSDFLRFPKVICEVLSESTERLDRREKRWGYQTIGTLEEYVLAAQDAVEVTVFRRAKNWEPQILNRLTQKLVIPSLKLNLPLATVYEGVRGLIHPRPKIGR